MKKMDLLMAGIAGTTAFTVFSYAMSAIFKQQFKEPLLLGKMIERLSPLNSAQAKFTGWLMDYLTGIIIAAAYKKATTKYKVKLTVKNGTIAGAITGLPASLVWDAVLWAHPAPPRERTAAYYVQLIAGHAVFGAVVFFVWNQYHHKRG